MAKKIGILGSGSVAQALAAGFLKHGYAVKMGTRDAAKLKEFSEQHGGKIGVGSFAEAALFGEIVVLAARAKAAKEVMHLAGVQNLNGKTVIDPSNPIDDAPPENGVLKFFTRLDRSFMEELQDEFPQVHFVKAFSMIGAPLMVNPLFSEKPTMFICGNNAAAKKTVEQILVQFGFVPEDMGLATSARAIEPLCMLWCLPGFLRNEWSHAIRLVKT